MTVDSLPEIGFGTYDITDPDICSESVETALDTGYRHIDTAEMYQNESAVGDGIESSSVDRDNISVATKISPDNLGYDDVIEHAHESLERLGLETLDLLYVHWPIRSYDHEETLSAFEELYSDGTIRNIGLSNFTPELLQEALETLDAPLFAHQVECHPMLQQEDLREYARKNDHYLVAYSPLAKGKVTEVPEIVEVAEKHDTTPTQVALAWLIEKENVVPIPKSSTESHIHENYGVLELSLDDEDIQRIDGIERRDRQVDFDGTPW